MFDMTTSQKQAFLDASGVSALNFNHLILFAIAILATVWLLLFFLGTYKSLRQNKIHVGEALFAFSIALFIYIGIGAIIFV